MGTIIRVDDFEDAPCNSFTAPLLIDAPPRTRLVCVPVLRIMDKGTRGYRDIVAMERRSGAPVYAYFAQTGGELQQVGLGPWGMPTQMNDFATVIRVSTADPDDRVGVPVGMA